MTGATTHQLKPQRKTRRNGLLAGAAVIGTLLLGAVHTASAADLARGYRNADSAAPSRVSNKMLGYCGMVKVDPYEKAAVSVYRGNDPWRRARGLSCRKAIELTRTYYRRLNAGQGSGSAGLMTVKGYSCAITTPGVSEANGHLGACSRRHANTVSFDNSVSLRNYRYACTARALSKELARRRAGAVMVDHRCGHIDAVALIRHHGALERWNFFPEDGNWVPVDDTLPILRGTDTSMTGAPLVNINALGRVMLSHRMPESHRIG